jgi:hypothetical protein
VKPAKKLKVHSVIDLGVQFKNNNKRMVGQDGGFSFKLNESETFWFFGDTFIGERTPGESLWYPEGKPVGPRDMSGVGKIEKMINNTGLISSGKCSDNGIEDFQYITDKNGEIKPLIELFRDEDHDEIRVWCLHGISLDSKVYLYFIKVRTIEEGVFPVNFEVLGSGLAKGDSKNWYFQRIIFNDSDLIWGAEDPKFASAILYNKENNYLYLYGVVQQNFVQNCYLARVAPGKIESFREYEYYIGDGKWSKKLDNAVTVFSGMPNELSVSYNHYLESFLAVHSHDLSGNIVGRTAPAPWGPWSEPVVLFSVKIDREQELPYPTLIYAGKEHPTLSEQNGKIIYITYIEFEEYFPHMIKIVLE